MQTRSIETASQKCRGIPGKIANLETAFGAIGVAEPALIDYKHVVSRRQQRCDPAERELGIRPPVKEQDGLTAGISLLTVVKTRPVFS